MEFWKEMGHMHFFLRLFVGYQFFFASWCVEGTLSLCSIKQRGYDEKKTNMD
jgi:hypothetical protein